MHTVSENRLHKYLYFLLLSAAFFALRLSPCGYVYHADGLRLIDPDSYYHLRRTLYTLQHFPQMLTFDAFLSYPAGDYVPWPPFYDLVSALLLKPFSNPLVILPALNMLYFYGAFAITYFYMARKNGLPAAVITGMLFSFAGILTAYSSFGRFDHHAMEMLIVVVFYLSFMEYFDTGKIPALIVMALATVAAFFNWAGAVIYFGPFFVFVAIRWRQRRIDPGVFKGLFVAFHLAAISIAIYLRFTKNEVFPPYSYKYLSAFQRDFCFLVSGIFGAACFAANRKFNKYLFWTAVAAVSLAAFHRFFFEIFNGLGFLTKRENFMVMVEEVSPLFFSPLYRFAFEFERNLSLFTPLLLILPVIVWLYWKKNGRMEILLLTLFFFVLTVNQLRFGIFFMIGYSIMTGVILGDRFRKITGYGLITAFLLFSGYRAYRDSRTAEARFVSSHIMEAMRFVREKTPLKEEFDAGRTPYGVLSSWDLGHYLIEVGKRPSVDNTFITLTPNTPRLQFPHALFSKEESGVLKVMNATGSRFLVMENPHTNLVTDWPLAGSGPNPFSNGLDSELRDPLRSYLYRLYSVDGMLPTLEEGTPERLRLVFELPANRKNYGIKIFEQVKGATITVPSGKDAVLKARIRTNRGRDFMYLSKGRLTTAGRVFVMPYSIDSPYDTKALEVYIEQSGTKRPVAVRDLDVMAGSILTLP